MERQRQLPIWPFVVVCAILFVLTLRAPHAWEKIAVPNVVRILTKRPRPHDNRALLHTVAQAPKAPTTTTANTSVMQTLGQTEAPRQVVIPQPRVASRIVPPAVESATSSANTALGPNELVELSPFTTNVATAPLTVEEAGATIERALVWPDPVSLKTDLEKLRVAPVAASWAEQVLTALTQLSEAPALASPESRVALDRLAQLSASGAKLADGQHNEDVVRHLRRTQYALARRVDIWQAVHTAAQSPQPRMPVAVARGQLANRVAVVDAYFRGLEQGPSWRQYMNIEETRQLAESRSPRVADVATLAYSTLGRLEDPSLTDAQAAVLADSRVQDLALELKKYLADPADLPQLLMHLEDFEHDATRANSRTLARTAQRLRWSPMAQLHTVGEKLDMHYRNANLRVAVRGDLINRMLPVMQTMNEQVDDEILGAQVQGTSQVSSRLSVRLIPDDRRLALALQAHGQVASDTEANHGPVTFYNQGQSQFVAEKVFRFDRLGLSSTRATAHAETNNELTGMSSSYDGVPLLATLVRIAARNQHDAMQEQANYEAQQRVSGRAAGRLEAETSRRLEESEKRMREKVLGPLVRLDLAPVPLELQTTAERMVARCRFATDEQLGAFTPRPLALSDSLLSLQVHESLFNNAIAQLKLDGRRVGLDELYRELASVMGRSANIPDDLPEGVTLQFAAEDALRVRLTDGRLTVQVRLAELSQGKQNKWKNFEVRGHYLPDSAQRTPTLVREGSIELVGEKLGLRDQVALRGIFSKVLDKKKPIPLVDPRLLGDARLADVAVTQLTLDQGWLGLSLGPVRTATEHVANEGPKAKR